MVVHPLTTGSQGPQAAVGGRVGRGKIAASHMRPVREGKVVEVVGRGAGEWGGVATVGR